MTPLQKLKKLSSEDKAYIAGFLDGDGCINAQIVRRDDYRLKFQIRVSITFFQKTERHWFLLQLKELLHYGTLRKRNDGMSEYTIIGYQAVNHVLAELTPYLRIKHPQAKAVFQIIKELSTAKDSQTFITLCEKVDHLGNLNDSRKRSITSQTVRHELEI